MKMMQDMLSVLIETAGAGTGGDAITLIEPGRPILEPGKVVARIELESGGFK